MKELLMREIIAYIRERRSVQLPDICSHFEISMSTLRRYISAMCEDGLVEKYYGGVRIRVSRELIPLSHRKLINYDGKLAIGRAAASLVEEGDVIYMDSGSTVGAMAQFLEKREGITVITNNYLVISRLTASSGIQLITLSGEYNQKIFSFLGSRVSELLRTYNVSKAFMGTSGFSLSSGITHSTQLEAAVKRTAVEIAGRVILLADNLKFGTVAPFTYCGIEKLDCLVTDQEPAPDFRKALEGAQVQLQIADAVTEGINS